MRENVTIRFKGLMTEKLIDRATSRKVEFTSVRKTGSRSAVLKTDRKGADELLKMAREFSLDVTEISSSGAGAIVRRIKNRWTFFAAMVIVGAVFISTLSRVWIIEVRMLDGGNPTEIQTALEQMGVKPGIRISGDSAQTIQTGIKAKCASYAYVGARQRGVRLLIEASQALTKPDIYNYAEPRDILASQDALVYSVDVLAGTAEVAPGSHVKKGDVLIRGVERDTRETLRAVNAVGSVIGRVWLSGEAQTALKTKIETPTGKKRTDSTLTLWNMTYEIERSKPFATEITKESFLPIGGIVIPVGIKRIAGYETKVDFVTRDMNEAKAEAYAQAHKNAMSKTAETVPPFDEWTDYTVVGNDTLLCRTLVEIRPDIATYTIIGG